MEFIIIIYYYMLAIAINYLIRIVQFIVEFILDSRQSVSVTVVSKALTTPIMKSVSINTILRFIFVGIQALFLNVSAGSNDSNSTAEAENIG